jgi:hypothetical protein
MSTIVVEQYPILFNDILHWVNTTLNTVTNSITRDMSPEIIGPLNTSRINFKKLKSSYKTRYYEYDTTHIVYSNSKNEYFCLDHDKGKVSYYMKYVTSTDDALGQYVWQSFVYRDDAAKYVLGLPSQIFFEKLLQIHGTICTDGQQTEDGRRFWDWQIHTALQRNINVYYYNLDTRVLIKIIDLIHFNTVIGAHNIWGSTDEHRRRLMVITKHEMPRS